MLPPQVFDTGEIPGVYEKTHSGRQLSKEEEAKMEETIITALPKAFPGGIAGDVISLAISALIAVETQHGRKN